MFTDLDWKTLLEDENLFLYVLPTIVKELDNEKFNNPNSKIRKRAQEIISKMIKIKREELKCKRFNLEFPSLNEDFEWKKHNLDPDNQDDCIIAEIIQLKKQLSNEEICLITSDFGMELKTEHHDIKIVNPLDEWKREEKDMRDKEIEKLRLENIKLQDKKPNLELLISSDKELDTKIKISRNELLNNIMTEEDLTYELKNKEEELKLNAIINPVLTQIASIPESEINRYDKESQEYLKKYEKYLHELKKDDKIKASIIEISPVIINNGTDVADDIDIFLSFPDFVELISEYDLPELPEKPEEPDKPRSMFNMFGQSYPGIFAYPKTSDLLYNVFRKTNREVKETGPSINQTEKEVTYWKDRLKHGLVWHCEPIYVKFPSVENLKSFEIDYSIHTSNVQDIKKGKLTIIIED
jgi:hypothetical protein